MRERTWVLVAVGLVAIPNTAPAQTQPGEPAGTEISHVGSHHKAVRAIAFPASGHEAEPLELLTIEVVAVNQARIPRETVKRAEQVATRIFLAAGIRLEWTNTAPDSVGPYRATAQQLKIHIVPASMQQGDRRLGVAERRVDNSDTRAFVFYNRVVDLARLIGVDIAPILGHTLAHEMGHVLLPYGAHTSQGIMQEEWDRAQFEAMARGLLTFTAQHTDLIRVRVQAIGYSTRQR